MKLQIGQIITQIIAFLIMLWVLRRYAWGPLLGVMDKRRKFRHLLTILRSRSKENSHLAAEYQAKIRVLEDEDRSTHT